MECLKDRKLLPTTCALLVLCYSALISVAYPVSDPELRLDPENIRWILNATGRTWDFSDCAPGCKLLLGNTTLNKRNLTLTTADTIKLSRLLHNENLEDRMYVWGKLATMVLHEIQKLRLNLTELDVEDLDKFEGDMVFTHDTVHAIFDFLGADVGSSDRVQTYSTGKRRTKRLATEFESFVWRDTIKWQFASTKFTSSQKSKVREAIRFLKDNTCVRFKEIPAPLKIRDAHISFVKDTRCWSVIGRQRSGQQLAIGDSCSRVGNILHELAHSLGLLHQHSRPDRDQYITVNISNSVDAKVFHNLLLSTLDWGTAKTLNIPYDYSSGMHYSAFAFSKNGERTISPKDPRMQHVLGQRNGLSFIDVKFINTLYNCAEICGRKSLEWDYCRNGGYRDPNNCSQCKCPPGFAPPSCAGLSPAVNAQCGKSYLQASETEQQLTSPGYPSGYPGNADCAWLIRAPSNQRVKLQFTGEFEIQHSYPSCQAYVEVRYSNITRTGARYCSSAMPTDIFQSHGEEMMMLLHTKQAGHKGFQLTYRAEKCGGCSSNSSPKEPVCMKTELYDCSVQIPTICLYSFCYQTRKNQCFRQTSYCCPGYIKRDENCIRDESVS